MLANVYLIVFLFNSLSLVKKKKRHCCKGNAGKQIKQRKSGNTMNCMWLAAAGFLTIKNPASTKWLMCFNKYQLFVWGVMNKLEPEWQLLQVIMKTACKLWPHLFQILHDDSRAAVAASFISEHFYFHISKVSVWWRWQPKKACVNGGGVCVFVRERRGGGGKKEKHFAALPVTDILIINSSWSVCNMLKPRSPDEFGVFFCCRYHLCV